MPFFFNLRSAFSKFWSQITKAGFSCQWENATIFQCKDTARRSRNQRSADSFVRAKAPMRRKQADKAVRAPEEFFGTGFNHGWTRRGAAATEVAQNYILLFRPSSVALRRVDGFVIRRPRPDRTTSLHPAPSRMQFGDTADYKSALRQSMPPRKSLRKATKFS